MRIYNGEYIRSLTYSWYNIAPMMWDKSGCRELPADEDYVFYDLEAEGNE